MIAGDGSMAIHEDGIKALKRRAWSMAAVAAYAVAVWALHSALPPEAGAIPFFARQIGRDCSFCHSAVPRLNETGREFRAGGYRFEDEGEWKGVRDYEVLPASFEVEVEAEHKRTKASGVEAKLEDVFVEEAELMAGGAFGREGRVTALVRISASETTSGTDVSIPGAFLQVNDLVGPTGAGRLNLRGGKWDAGLPFLYPAGRVISKAYLADTAMRVMATGVRGFEANGTVVSNEGERRFAHRYGAGLVREDISGGYKLRGLYGYYSLSIDEFASAGVIYRHGEDASGTGGIDTDYDRYGLSVEADAGVVVATLGFFHDSRSGEPGRSDYLAELLYLPAPRIGVAARYEVLREDGKRNVTQQSAMARYNVMSNAYVQAEMTEKRDPDHAVGTDEYEAVAKILLVAMF